MKSKLIKGRFIHIVASVELDTGNSEILYVNPSSFAIEPITPDENTYRVELQFIDAEGRQLFSHTPQLQIASCDDSSDLAYEGLINESVSYVNDIKEIRLFVNENEQSRYVAGDFAQAVDPGVALGGPLPDSPHRRGLTARPDASESGFTYTIQARPVGESQWQTISVGRSTPDIDVNVNQFPSAERIDVRVLKTNGVDEEVILEEEIAIDS